ncbi:two-component system, LytT family, response regulator [Flexibacter flexilis DSM 6793]|uniref:Two-component system, LytT family, response regulator n=1 Tax=Flexibacter flexilis DSM 6793 TaxID=927664 RepID=A0A1I1K5S2_9BACT|nr:LytTR family DNA-binding domain-containing protein [Flexibacter flexilis]SFC55582.1 two-component system, LytT family, response regulator [Flexibacter flexilis DSM 6793]
MLKILLIDDEPNVMKAVAGLLREFHPEHTIVAQCHTVPEAVIAIKQHHPHLVISDIEMPQYPGFELFQFFLPEEVNFSTVFLTGYSEYSLKAFEVGAIDYLLKPLQPDELARALKRAEKRFLGDTQQQNGKLYKQLTEENLMFSQWDKISLPMSEGIRLIKIDEIVVITADRSYSVINMISGEKILISKSLSYFDKLEQKPNFLRVHRSYTVNLQYVRTYSKTGNGVLELSTGERVPIGSEKKAQVETMLGI